jgi:hypothetical protein
MSILQINPLRPNPSHSVTEIQSFPFRVQIFSCFALAKGARIFFSLGSEPAIDGPVDGHNVVVVLNVGVVLNLTIRIIISLIRFSRDIPATVAAIPVRRQPGSTRLKSI